MMHDSNHWMGGQMWIWSTLGALLVALLLIALFKRTKK